MKSPFVDGVPSTLAIAVRLEVDRAARLVACLVSCVALASPLAGCKKSDRSSSLAAGPSRSALVPATPAPAMAAEIAFHKKDPAVGMVVSVVDTSDTAMSITKPTKVEAQEREKTERTIEILTADGPTVTRIKVTYVDKAVTEIDDGVETTRRPVVRGRSYVVESANGSFLVTDDKRNPVKKEELDIVAADFADEIGKPDRMLASLPDVPIKVGDAVDGLAAWIERALSSMGRGVEITTSTVRLEKITPDPSGAIGTFDVKASVSMKTRGVTVTHDLAGSLDVAEDGHVRSFALRGPLALKGAGAEGTGTTAVSQTRSYP